MSDIFADPFITGYTRPTPTPTPSQNLVPPQPASLDDELENQLTTAKQLLEDAKFDETVPLNQKAQVINSIVAIIAAINKQKAALHNLAELALIETALIETLKEFPEVRERFIEAYTGRALSAQLV
jgi:hypothetical protein